LRAVVPGCAVIVGGIFVLATEFPAAQRVLDQGMDTIRNFAESKGDYDLGVGFEVVLGLGFEVVDDPNAKTPKTGISRAKESFRDVTRKQILPLLELMSQQKEAEKS